MPMEKVAGKSNVNQTMNVAMIKCAKITCARLFVFWVNHADLMHCALLKTTSKFANVNQDSQETRKWDVLYWISAKILPVDQELLAKTVEDRSDVSAQLVWLEMLTRMVAKRLLNARLMMTVLKPLNVFRKMEFQNVEMFVRKLLADQMLTARLKYIRLPVFAAMDMMVWPLI